MFKVFSIESQMCFINITKAIPDYVTPSTTSAIVAFYHLINIQKKPPISLTNPVHSHTPLPQP